MSIPTQVLSILQQLSATVGSNSDSASSGTAVWRPPQWGQPATYAMTVTYPSSAPPAVAGLPSPDQIVPLPTAPSYTTVYVFDAILRALHVQELEMTQHPVQTGANISDHAYLRPAELTLEIGMSDAMASYTAGNWTGNASKSVAAFQTLLTIQSLRLPVTISTRLKTYSNMQLKEVKSEDTYRTRYGLRALVHFVQIISGGTTAQNQTSPQSARPQTTDSSSVGETQTETPSASLINQNNYSLSNIPNLPKVPKVPGAGNWSSTNLNSLAKVLFP